MPEPSKQAGAHMQGDPSLRDYGGVATVEIPDISLSTLVRTEPAMFVGRLGDHSLEVHLDISAILKLEGNASFEERSEALKEGIPRVVDATRRLLQERREKPNAEVVVITISAIDLD